MGFAFKSPGRVPTPSFTDGDLARLQRAVWNMPCPSPPPRPAKRIAQPRVLVIADGPRLKRLMSERGFADARSLAVAAGLWPGKSGPVALAMECGELGPKQARQVADALGCEPAAFTLGIRRVDPGQSRGHQGRRS